MEFWYRLNQFIKEFEEHASMHNPDEDQEFFDTWELDMAKALLADCPESAIRVSKIILALKDVNNVRVRIE